MSPTVPLIQAPRNDRTATARPTWPIATIAVRVSFSNVPQSQLEEGARRLGGALAWRRTMRRGRAVRSR
jgi:hypothetical protein